MLNRTYPSPLYLMADGTIVARERTFADLLPVPECSAGERLEFDAVTGFFKSVPVGGILNRADECVRADSSRSGLPLVPA